MTVFIIIFLLFLGYIVFKYISENEGLKRIDWAENQISKYKSKIIDYHSTTIIGLSTGEVPWLFAHTKKEKEAKIAEWKTEISKIKLWDKHCKTVLASDTYSQYSKKQLLDAWFSYLSAYSGYLQKLEVIGAEPGEYENVLELKETFLEKLEAFGYDGVKEEKEMYQSFIDTNKKKK